MPTRNVNLTEHLDSFFEGRDKAKLKGLRAAVKEGIDDIERGDYTTIRSDQEIKEFMRQVRTEARGADHRSRPA